MTYSKLILLMCPKRLNKFSPCKLFFDQRSRLHNDLCSQVRAQFPIMGTRGMERVVIHCLNQKLNLSGRIYQRQLFELLYCSASILSPLPCKGMMDDVCVDRGDKLLKEWWHRMRGHVQHTHTNHTNTPVVEQLLLRGCSAVPLNTLIDRG